MQTALPQRRKPPYVTQPWNKRLTSWWWTTIARSATCSPASWRRNTDARHRGAGRQGGAPRLRQRPLPSGGARPDAAWRGGPRIRALAPQPVRDPNRHADRDGRGDRPHHRPRTWRRRLRAEAVQPTRTAGEDPCRAATRRRCQGAARRDVVTEHALCGLDAGAGAAAAAQPRRCRSRPNGRRIRPPGGAGRACQPRANAGHAPRSAAWPPGWPVRSGDRCRDQPLRRKLEDDGRNAQLIKTVRGGGYVLAATVERA